MLEIHLPFADGSTAKLATEDRVILKLTDAPSAARYVVQETGRARLTRDEALKLSLELMRAANRLPALTPERMKELLARGEDLRRLRERGAA